MNEEPISIIPKEPEENGNKYFSATWELLKVLIIAALIVLPIRYFIFQPFIVKGDSMIPNFHSGDYLIVDELSYRFTEPARGDVVVLKYPIDQSQRFIKRIVGLPGETVEVSNGKVTITPSQGVPFVLDEKNYLPDLINTDGDTKVILKTDQYFVLGDNRQFSYDSRRWGVLPRYDIIGKALLRIYPFRAMAYIQEPSY